MAIEFRCPNGHRLSCPVERAGTAGKCPKCGVPFVVPSAEVAAAASGSLSSPGLTISDSAGPGSGRLAMDTGPAVTAPRPALAPQIIFLCPNGHKLNCPPSMQGKAGKCPHCGARFLIPMADESFSDDDSLDDGSELEALEGSNKDFAVEQVPEPEVADAPDGSGPLDLPPDFMERIQHRDNPPQAPPPPAPSLGHDAAALAHSFRELWELRGRGGVLRIHLRSGVVVTPDRYAAQASDDECAIFASKEEDGAYSISAIAWTQVERISLDGVKNLPEGLFH